MTPETLQIALAVLGWLVAFLLGKELATGLAQWRSSRARRTSSRRRP